MDADEFAAWFETMEAANPEAADTWLNRKERFPWTYETLERRPSIMAMFPEPEDELGAFRVSVVLADSTIAKRIGIYKSSAEAVSAIKIHKQNSGFYEQTQQRIFTLLGQKSLENNNLQGEICFLPHL
jgi:hypothetical protein